MPRLTIAVVCAALALTLGACGKDDENETSGDTATVTTNPTPAAGTSTQSEAQESDDIVSVGIKDIKFVPAEITAKVGQTIMWTNHEPVPHNVTAEQGADFRSDNAHRGRHVRLHAEEGRHDRLRLHDPPRPGRHDHRHEVARRSRSRA